MTNVQCAPCTSGQTELDPISVSRLLEEGKARLIDVRDPAERARLHVPASEPMPLESLEVEKLPVGTGQLIIFHCQGGTRSRRALERALAGGRGTFASMKGGIVAWKAAGLPVIENRRAPRSPMQQTQILMGLLVLIGTILGAFVTPFALLLSGFIGCGMIYAGLSGSCAMANLLGAMPWNRTANASVGCGI